MTPVEENVTEPATSIRKTVYFLPAALRPGTKLYDFIAALPLIAWYGLSVVEQGPMLVQELRVYASSGRDPVMLMDALTMGLALLFAGLVIGFVIMRQPARVRAQGILPRAVAFLGAYLAVGILVLPHQTISWQLDLVATFLILAGTGISLWALLWLGRSISVMPEARELVTSGPYAIVRHPLYLGDEVALGGVALLFLSPAGLAVFAAQFALQLYRIHFEEQVLGKAFPDYAAYSTRVKRLIPGLY